MSSNNNTDEHKTLDWVETTIPCFDGKKVFVLQGAMYAQVVTMMAKAGFDKAEVVTDADLVVFTGGSDVDPSLYGDDRCDETRYTNPERDAFEKQVFVTCVENNIPMFGICRGAQFLHVMNGGKLWQDVDGHSGPDHYIYDIDEDKRVLVTSLHHQMLKFNEKMELLACCEKQIATNFKDGEGTTRDDTMIEVEAGYYHQTKCFFVQGHPEVGSDEFQSWTFHKLEDILLEWGVHTESEEKTKQLRRGLVETVKRMIG